MPVSRSVFPLALRLQVFSAVLRALGSLDLCSRDSLPSDCLGVLLSFCSHNPQLRGLVTKLYPATYFITRLKFQGALHRKPAHNGRISFRGILCICLCPRGSFLSLAFVDMSTVWRDRFCLIVVHSLIAAQDSAVRPACSVNRPRSEG